MREFTSPPLSNPLKLGLRPNERMRIDSEYLEAMMNLESLEYGISGVGGVVSPFSPMPNILWPFPIFYKGKKDLFLLGKGGIGIVSREDYTSQNLAVRNIEDDGVYSISAEGYWHIADSGDSWYMFDGKQVVFKSGFEDVVRGQQDVGITTGCVHRGRVICGGFDPLGNIGKVMEGILGEVGGVDMGFDKSTVLWSSIGGGDFPLLLFAPDSVKDKLVGNKEEFLSRLKRNEFGWMQCPNVGEIVKLMPLGGSVMVYGTEGIGVLNLREGFYGWEDVLPFGINGRGCVGGNEDRHFFVNTRGDLWGIVKRSPGQPFGPFRLGYKEYIQETFVNSECVVSYTGTGEGEWKLFISGNDVGFVLNPLNKGFALSRVGVRTTGVGDLEGGIVGVRKLPVGSKGSFTTPVFDLGFRAIKTLTEVALGIGSVEGCKVFVEYRSGVNEDWRITKPWPVNNEGNAYVRVAGVEFRITVETDYPDSFFCDYFQVKYQASDNRTIRGPVSGATQ